MVNKSMILGKETFFKSIIDKFKIKTYLWKNQCL